MTSQRSLIMQLVWCYSDDNPCQHICCGLQQSNLFQHLFRILIEGYEQRAKCTVVQLCGSSIQFWEGLQWTAALLGSCTQRSNLKDWHNTGPSAPAAACARTHCCSTVTSARPPATFEKAPAASSLIVARGRFCIQMHLRATRGPRR